MGPDIQFNTAEIKVYVTKSGKFRAKIKEKDKVGYEVSLGGKNWKLGIGRKFETTILKKAAILSRSLIDQLNKLTFSGM